MAAKNTACFFVRCLVRVDVQVPLPSICRHTPQAIHQGTCDAEKLCFEVCSRDSTSHLYIRQDVVTSNVCFAVCGRDSTSQRYSRQFAVISNRRSADEFATPRTYGSRCAAAIQQATVTSGKIPSHQRSVSKCVRVCRVRFNV